MQARFEESLKDVKYRLLALDLDGTLLHTDRQISEATVQYLRQLNDRGLQIAFCTGKSARSTHRYIQQLNLPSSNPFPLVSTNGAKIIMVHRDEDKQTLVEEILQDRTLSEDAVQEIKGLATSLGYVTLWYYNDAIYANPTRVEHHNLVKKFQRMIKTGVTTVVDDFRLAQELHGMPYRIVVLFSDTKSDKPLSEFSPHLHGKATIAGGPKGFFLEILDANVNKGNGLRDLCHFLDVPLSRCVAMGDGDNDKEFLHAAGFGICMRNGTKDARVAADAVTEWSNDQDGVFKTLKRLEDLNMLCLEHAEDRHENDSSSLS